METFDVVVIGGGVVGTSVAFHLSKLGATNVLLLERETIGSGTTAQSSGILRTHYSVRENVEVAKRSWDVFNDFAAYVGDAEASCGLVRCGYLISAAAGDKLEPLRACSGRAGGAGNPARGGADGRHLIEHVSLSTTSAGRAPSRRRTRG